MRVLGLVRLRHPLSGGESANRIFATATNFLASLAPDQRRSAVFPADDPERKDWSNLPYTMHPRKGICLGDLSPAQRVKAHQLIQAGLSSQGYLKASGIMQLDESCWLCGTNSAGFITLHVLEECSKAEAWQFFETMRGPNTKHINPRMTFVGGPSVPANN